MKLKANFHFHTADDPHDKIKYTFKEGVDHAASLGFEVIALTCHAAMRWTSEYSQYAASKNILLLSGIELYMGGKKDQIDRKHLVLLNCDKGAEYIETFADLENYRKTHPDIFVLAAHPYFYGNTLKELLEKHIHLIDGIEHSWFYSKRFNRNKKAAEIAQKYNRPLIATSDTHYFKHMNKDYAVIDAEEKTTQAIFAALRQHKFQNITSPKKFFRGMAIPFGIFTLQNFLDKH